MLIDFQDHINSSFPFLEKSNKLLVAVSGGIDSIVMTHILYELGYNVQLAHCNFRLRKKESDLDEKFVIDLAEKLNLKLYTKSFDTEHYALDNKISIQMAARQLRYAWFDELKASERLDYLITAHNLNDNLETFLINFTRGTGLEGLAGISQINGTILRPLLNFSRKQIEEYAQENKINWREDSSNAETKYTRNKIRHQILPLLKEINPSLFTSFKDTTAYLQQSQEVLNETILKLRKNVFSKQNDELIKVDIKKIKELSSPQAYMYELFKEFGFSESHSVFELLSAQSGKQLMSLTHRLVKDRDFLLLESLSDGSKSDTFSIEKGKNELKTNEFSIHLSETKDLNSTNPNKINVDEDLIIFPLTIRKWQKGDYFYPLGMRGKKKLSKFFKDEKYSLIDKENAWILCSGNSILWVMGKRMDDRFKVTEKTKKIVQIKYSIFV